MAAKEAPGQAAVAAAAAAERSEQQPPPQQQQQQQQEATVLMSCRVCGGPGPGALGDGEQPLFLLLSMERPGEFRLRVNLRHSRLTKSLSLYDFNLKDITYAIKSPSCHSFSSRGQPSDQLVFHFEDPSEAQKWSTIITSSLREIQKANCAALPANSPGVVTNAVRPATDPPQPWTDLPKPSGDLSRTEDLILRLAKAIETGDLLSTAESAKALAQQKVSLSIRLKETAYLTQQISMKVGVEDSTSSATIIMKVFPYATINTLKQQIFRDYGFHPSVQRWIIGQCLAVDERTISSYGVKKDGDPAFLYLLSAKLASLSRRQYEEEQALAIISHGEALPDLPRRLSLNEERQKYSTLPPRPSSNKGRMLSKDREGRMDITNISQYLKLELKSLPQLQPSQDSQPPTTMSTSPQNGWSCRECTYINKPTRPGCEMCSSPRPPEYSVPQQYSPDDAEMCRILQEKEAMLQYHQELEQERLQNYQHLLRMDNQDLVPNREPIECRICLTDVMPEAGVVLRDCLHSFCKECLSQLIQTCLEPTVPCPYRDETYACDSKLQEREIRALVSLEEFCRFLERSVTMAERSSENSYHCQTVDCRGWCFYEDTVNEFLCPLCRRLNCLLCKAIHAGMNCKQYQDDLRSRAQSDSAALQTTEMLKTLVRTGQAMHCPTCNIIVQKKDGCDWLRCTVCHTEICWVTKGHRWGPKGPGDTDGGCRCLVNGKRCHPSCQNCH
ncbi:ranBP-type and C3HC4-type zinc finger-containing protein 1 [Callorhinchus milii]|uniref:RanBP-type and C3HC4-type zinc finger-containing protein 1 n=1 Tax=Callorhinchus milii TaxID=7868 RepID=A0A4W3GMV6_CALMI|nr:ranBP-type and C3HC4-type zinc finger-containing protein 1 [Callorhinchus milii]|eukprot:gi/632955025/ref/XP_007893268.1/ PREDICTED: sharpin [Callorhinchus milii]